jgi:hypothetical protein
MPNSTGFYRLATEFYRSHNQRQIACLNRSVLEINESEATADAADSVFENVNGFAIRFCPGPRPHLRYQAGKIVTEQRHVALYTKGAPVFGWKAIPLFHLLGYGETQDEAIDMAKMNANGRKF